MPDPAVERLQRALERFPMTRFPVKHASIQRRLAASHIAAGAPDEAERALRHALAAYGDDLPRERAATLNSLGSLLRDAGRLEEATAAFEGAVSLLGGEPRSPEAAGALFNLGLVRRGAGHFDQAETCFRAAADGFDPLSNPAELAAALRELGAILLTRNDLGEAMALLESAGELAARGADRAGLAGSLNLLGLAQLAAGEGDKAVASFTEAAAAHPVTLRPEMHSMAKANLALAYEACDDRHRARMLAQQALSISAVPDAVRSQASQTLDRLGPAYDLHHVLDGEPLSGWDGVLRDEVWHWLRLDTSSRQAAIEDWIAGQLRRAPGAVDRCASLLSAILELPPEGFETLTTGLALAREEAGERASSVLRGVAARAAARFSPPQMARLQSALGLSGPEIGRP